MSVEDPEALRFLAFWFSAGPAKWFSRNNEFDASCRGYVALWERARDGGCDAWAQTAAGSLARIILLDQIPRNIFRDSPKQYSTDDLALSAAYAAIDAGHDVTQTLPCRNFYYLPLEHAEDLAAQERCLDLLRPLGDKEFYYWALVHADAIRRFGRFPHRNAMLGRETTEAEAAYLASGGFGY
ncbi:MAG: DUF924 family protein [Pseudomonadota bacterium]